MSKPVSIFMMDVTNSTKNWEEITSYLKEIEKKISKWSTGLPHSLVKHRLGDEIVAIFDHYATAYTVAFYITQIWKHQDQPPYFGITFGNVDEDLTKIDLDTWNHPMMRHARKANEAIKNSSQRTGMLFEYETKGSLASACDMTNLLLQYQHKLMSEQTSVQRVISMLYSILGEQKAIASIVKKSPSTISSHYKKGNCEIILKTMATIQKTLNELEVVKCGNQPQHIVREIEMTIKNNLKAEMDKLL
ncbi:hypothetical protein FIU87_10540 [Bacillus sp. THAF10]|nr:hypothetical protein FIU87_10540 [Bacillus sp. THAF10]